MERIPDQELLDEVDRFAEGCIPPLLADVAENGQYSKSAYYNRWDSWDEVLRAAGYDPSKRCWTSKDQLIKQIQRSAENNTGRDILLNAEPSRSHIQDRFHSEWAAYVRAGISPPERHPLSPAAIGRFHDAAVTHRNPHYRVVSLLFEFTGITPTLLTEFTADWHANLGDTQGIKVPAVHIQTEEPWSFKLPKDWTDPRTDRTEPTGLPNFFEWYIDVYGSLELSDAKSMQMAVRRVAEAADLGELRSLTEHNELGPTPKIRPQDLRATLGVNMARNSAPSRYIKRHLGVEKTGWRADVQEFFIWLDEHENFSHPDYDGSGEDRTK